MSVLGWFHLLLGVLALIVGAIVMLQPKGTRRHVFFGRLFVAAMLALNVTALMIYNLTGRFGPFHVAAVASLATLVAGFAAVFRRRQGWLARHTFYMKWSFIGLLAATAAEITSRVPGWDFVWSVTLSVLTVVLTGGALIGWRAPRGGAEAS